MKVFYSPEYVTSKTAFDTTRKSGWIAESLDAEPISGVTIVAPEPLTFDEIAAVHDRTYVEAVRTGSPRDLAESQGFEWDPGMWTAVTASNGGAVAAVRAARADGVAGTLSSGLHHARRERGSSFCTFNGLVIAARAALAEGAGSVLIVDLDAHCGGGTHSLIADDDRIRQIDVSVSGIDSYRQSGANTLDIVKQAGDYLKTVQGRLDNVDWAPTLCIYNAGMDPHEKCVIGGLRGIDRTILERREELVFEWCTARSIPVAFSLAGGYVGSELTEEGLVDLHRLTLNAASSVWEETV